MAIQTMTKRLIRKVFDISVILDALFVIHQYHTHYNYIKGVFLFVTNTFQQLLYRLYYYLLCVIQYILVTPILVSMYDVLLSTIAIIQTLY